MTRRNFIATFGVGAAGLLMPTSLKWLQPYQCISDKILYTDRVPGNHFIARYESPKSAVVYHNPSKKSTYSKFVHGDDKEFICPVSKAMTNSIERDKWLLSMMANHCDIMDCNDKEESFKHVKKHMEEEYTIKYVIVHPKCLHLLPKSLYDTTYTGVSGQYKIEVIQNKYCPINLAFYTPSLFSGYNVIMDSKPGKQGIMFVPDQIKAQTLGRVDWDALMI